MPLVLPQRTGRAVLAVGRPWVEGIVRRGTLLQRVLGIKPSRRQDLVQVMSLGAVSIGAITGNQGQTLYVPVTVTIASSETFPVNVQILSSLYANQPGTGGISIAGIAYPVVGPLSAGGSTTPSATIQPGQSAAFTFTFPNLPAGNFGVYFSIIVTDATTGGALAGSPLTAWSNAFLTTRANAGSVASFGTGTASPSSLSIGGYLTIAGASVTAQAGYYWTFTEQAVDQSGNVLVQTQQLGSGNQSFNLTLGPINQSGASIHLVAMLNVYSDAARTQQIQGSPLSQSTGVVATVQSAPAVPGSISSGPTYTLSGDVATVTWGAAPNATGYEAQTTDSGGNPLSPQPYQWFANGVATSDPSGSYGDFGAGTTAVSNPSIPAGTTIYFRVRGANGSGPQAMVGQWSNLLAITTPAGAPDVHIQSVSTSSGSPSLLGLQATVIQVNSGTAAGLAQAWTAVAVGPDGYVWGTANYNPETFIQPGATYASSGVMQPGSVPSGYPQPPAGTYTIYAVLGQGYASYAGAIAGTQSFAGAVSGSAQTSTSAQAVFLQGYRVSVRPRGFLVRR